MSKLADQIAALEAQVDGARAQWIIVAVAPFTFKIARWVDGCDYYDVDERYGSYGSSATANGALVGMGLVKEVVLPPASKGL